jgi:formylglycine-generating enzyme required for sulfatase activity
VANIKDSPLRTALALSVGCVQARDVSASNEQAWQSVFSNWYQTQPDSGTHSAAGWALRRWNLELPAIVVSNQPSETCHWYVNSVGITMLKLPAGSFVGEDEAGDGAGGRTFTVSKPFLLADREVTRGQFEQFIDDPECPQEEKPVLWDRVNVRYCPTEQHPVQYVNWFAAVRFCNWLSRREGLTPCYQRTGQKQKLGVYTYEVWDWVSDADGYRLPTEVEWEYACRAGSETLFHFGDDTSLLDCYGVHRVDRPEPVGSKMPNAWGLFDMHGNVLEWCQDWNSDFTGDLMSRPPRLLTRIHHAERSGAFFAQFTEVRSAVRVSMEADMIGRGAGFRVARNCP